jgi:hypothetical protein
MSDTLTEIMKSMVDAQRSSYKLLYSDAERCTLKERSEDEEPMTEAVMVAGGVFVFTPTAFLVSALSGIPLVGDALFIVLTCSPLVAGAGWYGYKKMMKNESKRMVTASYEMNVNSLMVWLEDKNIQVSEKTAKTLVRWIGQEDDRISFLDINNITHVLILDDDSEEYELEHKHVERKLNKEILIKEEENILSTPTENDKYAEAKRELINDLQMKKYELLGAFLKFSNSGLSEQLNFRPFVEDLKKQVRQFRKIEVTIDAQYALAVYRSDTLLRELNELINDINSSLQSHVDQLNHQLETVEAGVASRQPENQVSELNLGKS